MNNSHNSNTPANLTGYPDHEVVEAELVRPGTKKKGFRNIFETLLDPQTLQTLMWCGSGLLVIGLMIWLWSVGVFENALFAAATLGGINLVGLGAGIAMVLRTRYQWAGRAITMLACLVMPLNLWFYHSHGLLTLDQGGHLWVPALVMSIIYAGVARLLKDSAFVYTIVGGITMTGILFMADQLMGRFWELALPSALLVIIGLICIHVERAFTTDPKSPFSRDRFGTAFLKSGYVALTAGLTLLLSGYLVAFSQGLLPVSGGWGVAEMMAVTTSKHINLALVGLGAYGFAFGHFVHGKKANLGPALFCVVWFVLLLLNVLAIELTFELALLAMALVSVALRAMSVIELHNQNGKESNDKSFSDELGISIAVLALLLAGGLFAGIATNVFGLFAYQMEWTYVAATAVISAAFGARLMTDAGQSQQYVSLNRGGAIFGATLTGLSILYMYGVHDLNLLMLVAMAAPLCIQWFDVPKAVSTSTSRDSFAQLFAIILMLITALQLTTIMIVEASAPNHLIVGAFFALNALLFGRSRGLASANVSVGTLSLALFFVSRHFGYSNYVPMIAGSLYGLFLIGIDRVKSIGANKSISGESSIKDLKLVSGRCMTIGSTCVLLSGVASVLMTISRLISGEAQLVLLGVMVIQAVVALLAMTLTTDRDVRKILGVLGIAEFVSVVGLLAELSTLTFFDHLELAATGLGVILLIAGYIGWYRETDESRDKVSALLALGSILTALPIVLGLLAHRAFGYEPSAVWNMIHEIGVLAIGMSLLLSGVMCRIKSSTLVGGLTVGVYVLSLIALIHLPEELQSVAVYMMVGGGVFFGGAILLSMYRDRLLKLPEKFREGNGIFQVFKWR